MLRYNLRYQLFLSLSDAVLVVVALAISSFLRINVDLGAEAVLTTFLNPPLLYPIAIAIWLFAFGQTGVYSTHNGMTLARKLRRVFAGHTLACLIFLGALYITYRDFSRLQAVYFMALLLAGVVLHRSVMTAQRHRLARYINTPRNILIVGVSDNARRLGSMIAADGASGLRLAGYVRALNYEEYPEEQVRGTVEDLPRIVRERQVNEIVVALKWFDQEASDLVSRIMRLLEHEQVNIRIAPDYSELAYFRAKPDEFNGVTIVGLREAILSPAERIAKRLFDIAFSLAVLSVTWPIFIVVAIAIRLDSPGPVIFRQVRIGQHGQRFTIYKFRSMHYNAERVIRPTHSADFIKRPRDPRVTRVGAFLRRTSMDELPQFINVLKGEMSVVGPRPEVTWLAEEYEWWQRKRFEVPQGITGWWQVHGRADKPMRFNIEEDLYYVRNYSIWLDMQIIVRTLVSLVTGKGAY